MTSPAPGTSTLIHATTVALGPLGIVIRGPSGSGKSDLALRFLSAQGQLLGEPRARCLVADDQTKLTREDDALIAQCPANIAGRIEVRGIGIVPIEPIAACVRVTLVVDLVGDIETIPRFPTDIAIVTILGIPVRRLPLYPFEPSAPLKLALAAATSG